jgi:hypothetical protein
MSRRAVRRAVSSAQRAVVTHPSEKTKSAQPATIHHAG